METDGERKMVAAESDSSENGPAERYLFRKHSSMRNSYDEEHSIHPAEAMMRETDADILERGLGESCSSSESATPVAGPLSNLSSSNGNNSDDVPHLMLSSEGAVVASGHGQIIEDGPLYDHSRNLRVGIVPSNRACQDRDRTTTHVSPARDGGIQPLLKADANKSTSKYCDPQLSSHALAHGHDSSLSPSSQIEYGPAPLATANQIASQLRPPKSPRAHGHDSSSSPSSQNEYGPAPLATANQIASQLRPSKSPKVVRSHSGGEISFSAQALEPSVSIKDSGEPHPESSATDIEEHLHRSKSLDRRLNEAAQFAEAVGEVAPTDENGILKEIIEEDSSSEDSDDDDATEVRLGENSDERALGSSFQLLRTVSMSTAPSESSKIPQDEVHSHSMLNRSISLGRSVTRSQSSGFLSGALSEEDLTALTKSGGIDVLVKDVADEAAGPDTATDSLKFKPADNVEVKSSSRLSELLKHRLPGGSEESFSYRGIRSNPPEITKRGISRGNYAQLHRKAWLEVSDKYHRYGKNLRLYYKHWESLGHPTNMFFDWLDSKGEAAGMPLPNIPECPRSELDSDTVLYITNPDVSAQYALEIVPDEDGTAIILDTDGNPVHTGKEGWIFVLRDHRLYGSQKVTSVTGRARQRFHHSSFFGGKAVAAAGILLTDECGRMNMWYPHSGHYRPGEAHVQRMLYFLQQNGIDLSTFEVDTQQILHVARKVDIRKGGAAMDAGEASAGEQQPHVHRKSKKVDSLHLRSGIYVAYFLAHKALMIGNSVFSQIHKLRRLGDVSVHTRLQTVDDGGYWELQRSECTNHSVATNE